MLCQDFPEAQFLLPKWAVQSQAETFWATCYARRGSNLILNVQPGDLLEMHDVFTVLQVQDPQLRGRRLNLLLQREVA
jgi:hypothetical protein